MFSHKSTFNWRNCGLESYWGRASGAAVVFMEFAAKFHDVTLRAVAIALAHRQLLLRQAAAYIV
jgi:hypothetical protein